VLIYKANVNVCTSSVGVDLESNKLYKQLFSEGIPTLEVQTVAFWINPYAGGTNSCFINQLSIYAGGTNSNLLNQPYTGGTSLRWWYYWCRWPVLYQVNHILS